MLRVLNLFRVISYNKNYIIMAHRITDSCIFCGACEPECPVTAIGPGEDSYIINEALCVDCVGHHDEPACVSVCPSECIIKV